MNWVIGATLGLIGFIAVLILGWIDGMSMIAVVMRGMIALGIGMILGVTIFGPIGMTFMKEAAGKAPVTVVATTPDVEDLPANKPEEKKPEEAAGEKNEDEKKTEGTAEAEKK